MFEIMDNEKTGAVIKVIGVGGGGGNAVANMVASGIEGVEYICANTDAQALKGCGVQTVLQLGQNLTKGLGAGANPDVGREAAAEDRERIKELIRGTDMLFITAGMGGGTGTGAAPVVAEIARDLGILTVAVVTRPFHLEGPRRMRSADAGIAELARHVDSLITIPNQKLLTALGKNATLLDAFKSANNVLLNAVQGIAELITRPGLINVDFADVRTVMSGMGMAVMGMGKAQGEGRAEKAAQAAVSNPLLEDICLDGAKGILVNITAGMDMGIHEFEEVGEVIRQFASDDATVVVGTVIDPDMRDEIRVTLVATGLEEGSGIVMGQGGKPGQKPVTAIGSGNPPGRAGTGRGGLTPPDLIPSRPQLRPVVVDRDATNARLQPQPVEGVRGAYPNTLDIPSFLRTQAD